MLYRIIVYIVYVFDESLYGIALGRETIEMHKCPLKTSCAFRGLFIS